MVKIISYKDLVDKLTEIFCEYGYDGTSLTILSQNTGLGRASLYYHFPGGKEEMANAVYEKITRDFTKLVLSPLATDQAFQTKIKNMLEGINLFDHYQYIFHICHNRNHHYVKICKSGYFLALLNFLTLINYNFFHKNYSKLNI